MGMEDILKYLIQSSDENFAKQIDYILKQLSRVDDEDVCTQAVRKGFVIILFFRRTQNLTKKATEKMTTTTSWWVTRKRLQRDWQMMGSLQARRYYVPNILLRQLMHGARTRWCENLWM